MRVSSRPIKSVTSQNIARQPCDSTSGAATSDWSTSESSNVRATRMGSAIVEIVTPTAAGVSIEFLFMVSLRQGGIRFLFMVSLRQGG